MTSRLELREYHRFSATLLQRFWAIRKNCDFSRVRGNAIPLILRYTFSSLRAVEDVPYSRSEKLLSNRLLQQINSIIQPAVVNDGISRIASHVKYREGGPD